MPETGHTWRMAFKGTPEEAARVREWTGSHHSHEDAPLIANELFAAVLGSNVDRRPDFVEITVSTAGGRSRIDATGCHPLHAHQIHGPGSLVVGALADAYGPSIDHRGLWATLPLENAT